jgi:hypothetical protein
MWTQTTVEQVLAQQERMLAEAAKERLLKLLPPEQGNLWQKAARALKINQFWDLLALWVVEDHFYRNCQTVGRKETELNP